MIQTILIVLLLGVILIGGVAIYNEDKNPKFSKKLWKFSYLYVALGFFMTMFIMFKG